MNELGTDSSCVNTDGTNRVTSSSENQLGHSSLIKSNGECTNLLLLHVPNMRVARLGKGEAATILTGAALSVTVGPVSCTELMRS